MSWGLALIEHAAGKPEQSNFGDRQSRTTARNCAMPDIMANRTAIGLSTSVGSSNNGNECY
jgi:hypothetical protein